MSQTVADRLSYLVPGTDRSTDEPGANGRAHATSRFERVILSIAIVLIPFQDRVISAGGVSVAWLFFAFVAGAIVLRRFDDVLRVATHRALLPVYAFFAITFLIEAAHPQHAWNDWFRTVQMVGGAIVVGAICRDRRAFLSVMKALLIAAVGLALLFIITAYGPLKNTQAATFREVSILRAETLSDSPLFSGINPYAALMAQGAGIATAFVVTARAMRRRVLFTAAALVCTLGVLMSLSRGGTITAVATVLAVLVGLRRGKARRLIAIVAVGAIFVMVVPSAVFARVSIWQGEPEKESRAKLFHASVDNIGDFAAFGIGEGNFRADWGWSHGFAERKGAQHVQGAHNTFLQIWIYWGILGLAAFLVALWSLYRGLPRASAEDVVVLSLRAIAAAATVNMLFTHTFFRKDFAFVLGLLLAERIWLRRRPSVPPSSSSSPGVVSAVGASD